MKVELGRPYLEGNKYLSSKCLTQVQIKHENSKSCNGHLKVGDDFLGHGFYKIMDGS